MQNSLTAIVEHQQSAEENTAGRQERVKVLMEDIYARREKGEKLRAETGDGRVRLATCRRDLEAARRRLRAPHPPGGRHGKNAGGQRDAAGSVYALAF